MSNDMGTVASTPSPDSASGSEVKKEFATWREFLAHHLSKNETVRALPNSKRMKKVAQLWSEYKSK